MSEGIAVPKKYLAMGRTVADRVPSVLSGRGLEPVFSDWLLTSHRDRVWLFGVLDAERLRRIERYTDPSTVHHLSTALRGLPVFVSNTNGLRYGFLLSSRPRLPRQVDFPSGRRGCALLGIEATGREVAVEWPDLGHLLVAGMTGYGKSTFLRLLVYQAMREGARLLVADLDGTTFPMLEGHPFLMKDIAGAPGAAEALVERALGECDHRAALYRQAGGYPENLEEYNEMAIAGSGEPLPRLLVVLDEFNATVAALGGVRDSFAGQVARLAWRGRKFGVHVVFAAQDFAKAVVGRVRDQIAAAICFRVRAAETARAVGCTGAHDLSIPGRAITDRWGPMQAYYLDKSVLAAGTPGPVLDRRELEIAAWALEENEGYLGLADLQERWELGQGEARRLALEWERRGWLRKDPQAANKRKVTDDLAALADKPTNLAGIHKPTDCVPEPTRLCAVRSDRL